jgi:hypothetical protein
MNDETPLSSRILAALGGMRDAMTAEDVKAVQRFARWIGEAEAAHAEIRLAEARQRFLDTMGEDVDLSHLNKDDGTAGTIEAAFRDSDGTATAAANEDLPVPQDCQARAEGIAPDAPDIHP